MHGDKGHGWDFLHVCVDDASRLAYTEVLPSEGQADTTAFLERALAWLARHGVTVERVMTDNGAAYRSKFFAKTLQTAGARHIRTRPYGSSAERAQAIQPWINSYNPTRSHAGIGGLSPWTRVNNLLGNDT
jgi:transposase InsO family protein